MRADGLAHCLIWKSTHINANTATHHAANTMLRFHCQSRPVSPNFTFLRGINKCFVQPELPNEGRSHSWDWYESKSCFRSANLKSFAVLGPISSISVSGKQQMTERERESKKKTQLKVASGLFPASFKCFYTFTDVWWHCASQSWAYLPTLHQNVSCMKCGVAQVSALLSATLGPQSFSLSLLWLPPFQMCYGSGSLSSRRFGGFSCVYHLFVCTFSLL